MSERKFRGIMEVVASKVLARKEAMPKTKFTSVFSTDNTTAEEVHNLISTGLEAYDPEKDRVDWTKVDAGEIGYSRGWLIIARAYVEQNDPKALVALPEPDKYDSKGAYEHAVGKVISRLRNQEKLSWGRIMILTGHTEGFVRKCYEAVGVQKAKGLRIGKGGRFAYSDPTLYLDNRKAEGAQIPKDLKGKPAIEQLLNFRPKEGDTNAATKGRAIGQIVKLRALRDDKATPTEQHEAIDGKIAELMNKYSISVQDIQAWEAHRANKGKGRKAA